MIAELVTNGTLAPITNESRHPAREVSAALGYDSHGGVHNAVRRVDANDQLRQTAKQLATRLD